MGRKGLLALVFLLLGITLVDGCSRRDAVKCDGETFSVDCTQDNDVKNKPNLQYVSIQSDSFYGRGQPQQSRWGGSTVYCDTGDTSDTNCKLPSAYDKMVSECNGKKQCSFVVGPTFFNPDPCPGISKYAKIVYYCAGICSDPGTHSSTTRTGLMGHEQSLTYTCKPGYVKKTGHEVIKCSCDSNTEICSWDKARLECEASTPPGGWSTEFGPWEQECTACGSRTRKKLCNNPPPPAGETCSGTTPTETEQCFCPVTEAVALHDVSGQNLCKGSEYLQVTILNNRQLANHVTQTKTSIGSITDCARLCHVDASCQSADYTTGSQTCVYNSKTWSSKDIAIGDLQPQSGVQHIEVKCLDPSDCKTDEKGESYQGTIRTTTSGKTCQRWDTQSPHTHTVNYGADVENFCRNPNKEKAPWCYTTDSNVEWEYCDILVCSDKGVILCPPGWHYEDTTMCFTFFNYDGASNSYSTVRDFCNNRNAYVVTMKTKEEKDNLKKIISRKYSTPRPSTKSYWLGLTDDDATADQRQLTWVDGKWLFDNATFRHWGKDEPDELGKSNYMFKTDDGYKWFDSVDTEAYGIVCEKAPYAFSSVSCGDPGTVANAVKSGSTYTALNSVTYTCNSGYALTSGNLKRTCLLSGAWTGAPPVCTRSIDPEDEVSLTTTSSLGLTITVTASSSHSCCSTSQSSYDSSGAWCAHDGSNSNDYLQLDLGQIVTVVKIVTKGKADNDWWTKTMEISTSFDGNTFLCVSGSDGCITFIGNSDRDTPVEQVFPIPVAARYIRVKPVTYQGSKCLRLDVIGTIQVKVCGDPGIPSNASRSGFIFLVGSSVKYTCMLGTLMSAGDSVRTCNVSGTWTGTLPTCSEISCGVAPTLPHTTVVTSGSKFDDIANYTCVTGYRWSSGDSILRCNETGHWAGSPLQCQSNLKRTCLLAVAWTGAPPVCTRSIDPEDEVSLTTTSSLGLTITVTASSSHSCCSTSQSSYNSSGAWCAQDGSNSNDYLQLDLGQVVTVVKIVTKGKADNDWWTKTMEISTSFDGNTFLCVSGSDGCITFIGNSDRDTPVELVFPIPVAARYIRVKPVTYQGRKCLRLDVIGTLQVKVCEHPGNSSNATRSGDIFLVGSSVKYTCMLGTLMSAGDSVRTCNVSGTWTGTLPICNVSTDVALNKPTSQSSTSNGQSSSRSVDGNRVGSCSSTNSDTYSWWRVNLQDVYRVHTVVITNVDTQYYDQLRSFDVRLSNESAAMTTNDPLCHSYSGTVGRGATEVMPCQSLIYTQFVYIRKTTQETLALCEVEVYGDPAPPANCRDPGQIANASKSGNDYTSPNTVTYTCNTGFTSAGGALTRQCQSSGLWSGVAPTCAEISCGAAPSLPHTSVVTSGSKFDDIANYTCVTGYKSSSGDSILRCNETGHWAGSPLQCQIVTCSTLGDVGNTTKLILGTTYLSETRYACKPGYRLVSGNLVRTCTDTGSWSGIPPVCEAAGDFITTTTCLGSTVNLTCPHAVNTSQTLLEVVTASFGVTTTGVCNATSIQTCPSNGTDEAIVRDECQYKTFCSVTPTNQYFGSPCPTNISSDPFLVVLYMCLEFFCKDPGNVTHGSRHLDSLSAGSNVTYTCDTGYEVTSGDALRTCHPSGTWTGVLPTCTAVDCGDPGNVTDGTRAGVTYYPGNMTYACDPGYRKFSGSYTRFCLADKQWSGILLRCIRVRCPGINPVENGLIADKGHFFQDTLNYTCIPGYELTNNVTSFTRICQASKTWSGIAPKCRRVNCGSPVIYNHTYIEGSSYLFGDVITYRCYYPYIMLSIDQWITHNCSENATWLGDVPVCNLGGCGDPGRALYSTRHVANFNTLQNVTYTCRLGYEWKGVGNLHRQCLKTGWTGSLPICDKKCCGEPDPVPLSKRYGNSFCYQDLLVYACNLGYELSAGDSRRICTENRTWTGSAPVCDRVKCGKPENTDIGVQITGSSYKVGDVVHYACKAGYFYIGGSYNRTCRMDKKWSAIPLRCKRMSCGQPPMISRTRRSGNSFYYQDVVLYTCFTGYNLTNGSLVKECLENGSWSGEDPRCDPIPGPPPNERKAAWKTMPKAEAAGSVYVGGIAIGLVAGTFGTMIILDLITIQKHLTVLKGNLRAGWKRYSTWKNARVHNKVAPVEKQNVTMIKVKPQ